MIRKDWRFSDEGDLELGSPKVNELGEFIYINRFGEISTDPSLGEAIRDVATHSEKNVVKQILRNRLKTDAPDWFHHPELGGNLSDLIGEPNTRATGLKGAEMIREAISYDNYVDAENINIRPVPISNSEILFLIELKDTDGFDLEYPVLFDLEHGVLSEYELPKED